MKTINFNAGPSHLPQETIDHTVAALKDFAGTGLSLACVSHRSGEFKDVVSEAEALFGELLNIPRGYKTLFLGGGASLQFAMVPMNFMKSRAGYLDTGTWSKKAIAEAEKFGDVERIAEADYFSLPKDYDVPENIDYFHVTSNNTIYGTQLRDDPEASVPLIADMSSDIFSRPIDVSRYALIYGGAQKNLGPAGATFVIVREDALGTVDRDLPTMLDYRTHIEKDSLYNTPPAIAIFACLQTLKWIKKEGGVSEMQNRNEEKAALLYDEIDRNPLFRATIANPDDRSRMNVCWVMADDAEEHEESFLDFAIEHNLVGLKGHRSVGGFRASIYNAVTKAEVETLIEIMQKFEKSL